jgi:hypothetical protein
MAKSVKLRRLTRWRHSAHFVWCGFRRQLRPFTGLFSFVGVIIVLGTFIAKDVLRDGQKDLVGSLEAARHEWILEQGVSNIEQDIMLVTKEVAILGSSSLPGDRRVREFVNLVLDLNARARDVRNGIDSNWVIYEKLWPHRRKAYAQRVEELANIQRSLLNEITREHPTLDTAIEKIGKINADITSLHQRVLRDTSDLTAGLMTELGRATRRLRTFTYISYVLYPLGVLIGVFSQLVGAETPASGK